MEPTAAVHRPRALDAQTVAEAFRITADAYPDAVAVRTQGGVVEWTWAVLRDKVDALAAGLSRLGVQRGDSVALQVYCEVGRWLGAATAKYISLFEPNILILGGGVLSASDLLLTQVKKRSDVAK